jgi:WhiB family transcriptional regulator, redox-sensing transcriptional regulator
MSRTVTDPTIWPSLGACVGADPDLFFPESWRDPAHAAKTLCSQCTVQPECLAHALDHDESVGVWGGLTAVERRHLRSRRRRLRLVNA